MKKRTMKFLYYSGIVVLYLLMVDGEYQNDCIVKDFHKKVPWFGEEVDVLAYVLENDVVNIKITYEHLDATEFFTTFYFSPSTNLSKRIETKFGENHQFQLKPMKKANDWIEFKISSEHGTIEVSYEPETHEQFSINQTSLTFKDLSIRASNISLCKEDRKWEVFEGNPQTIPLGRDALHKSFLLRFRSYYDMKPVISIYSTTKSLHFRDYKLTVEQTKVILKPLKDQGKDINFEISHNLITIDISSEGGKFNVTLTEDLETTAHLSPSPNITATPVGPEESCQNCNNYIVGFSCILSIFIILTCIVGLGFKTKTLHLRMKKIKLTSDCKNENIAVPQQEEITEMLTIPS